MKSTLSHKQAEIDWRVQITSGEGNLLVSSNLSHLVGIICGCDWSFLNIQRIHANMSSVYFLYTYAVLVLKETLVGQYPPCIASHSSFIKVHTFSEMQHYWKFHAPARHRMSSKDACNRV